MKENKLILVYYISTIGLENERIEEYFYELKKRISSQSISDDSEIIFIPIKGETRIECINPKYITNSELIKKHERAMSVLHEHLDQHVDEIENRKE